MVSRFNPSHLENEDSPCPSTFSFRNLRRWPEIVHLSTGLLLGARFGHVGALEGKNRRSSYLLTGVAATGNDGHTANFHDCRNIFISTESNTVVGNSEYVHFILKVPVAARFWRVVCRDAEQSRSKCSFFRLGGRRVQGKRDLCDGS